VSDADLGVLAYTRIYSGVLEAKSTVSNSTLSVPEKINSIYRVRANKYVSIPEAQAGDIVAIQGLRNA
jgi:elongation factor G